MASAPRLSWPSRSLLAVGVPLLAIVIWVPTVRFCFAPDIADYRQPTGVPEGTRAIAARHLRLWLDPAERRAEIEKMRGSNAEWDFMGRTYLVLALANMALREPARQNALLEVMDQIIDETLRLERDEGMYFFLMPYAHHGEFASHPARSLFVDGEIAMMLAARLLVADKASYRAPLSQRVGSMLAYMQRSPVLSGESYPDECWTFCNTTALAAIRMSDVALGQDHGEALRAWVRVAKQRLVDPGTGLLVSSYTLDGRTMDGPEGSSIWMAAHNLLLIDEPFARDQYIRARRELGRELLGFGYAVEWPPTWRGPRDIDSGPIVPVLEVSAGSSGLALLGASAFGDHDYLSSLLTTLRFAAFPSERDGVVRFHASNQVGDAVLLYALVFGPLWQRVKRG